MFPLYSDLYILFAVNTVISLAVLFVCFYVIDKLTKAHNSICGICDNLTHFIRRNAKIAEINNAMIVGDNALIDKLSEEFQKEFGTDEDCNLMPPDEQKH